MVIVVFAYFVVFDCGVWWVCWFWLRPSGFGWLVWAGAVYFNAEVGFLGFVVYSGRVAAVCRCCWLISVVWVVCGLLLMCICIWVSVWDCLF